MQYSPRWHEQMVDDVISKQRKRARKMISENSTQQKERQVPVERKKDKTR